VEMEHLAMSRTTKMAGHVVLDTVADHNALSIYPQCVQKRSVQEMTIVALLARVMKVHAHAQRAKLKLMRTHAMLKPFRSIATAVQALPSQVGTLASGLETSWWDSGAQCL